MINPVVIFPMLGRHKMVKLNIELLLKETCTVIVGYSNQEDLDFIRSLGYPAQKVQPVPCPNNPLGLKFQTCVNAAKILHANPLIVTGSDDILSAGFISKACEYVSKGIDFLCLNKWFIHNPKNGTTYSLKYKMTFPLGGGRVFSRDYLYRKDWKLYDTSVDVRTDDYAWNNLMYEDNILFNVEGFNILSIKGNWDTMNSLDRILKADNISWKEEHEIDKFFNFEKPVKEIFAYGNIH